MEIDAKPFVEVGDQIATRPDSWDAVLLPVNTARNLTRLYTYWHSSGQLAVSGFTGADDALEALRSSESDASTQGAARDVQRILHEEAPAIFLAASQDARAVSRRFEVPDEPGRDVVETLWRWRLAGETPEN
jgi:ABC-type transport system substrate-binding protein